NEALAGRRTRVRAAVRADPVDRAALVVLAVRLVAVVAEPAVDKWNSAADRLPAHLGKRSSRRRHARVYWLRGTWIRRRRRLLQVCRHRLPKTSSGSRACTCRRLMACTRSRT